MKAAFAMSAHLIPYVFGDEEFARLREVVDLRPGEVLDDPSDLDGFADVEVLITGWGVPRLGADALDRMPHLRAVVHWGGGAGFLDDVAGARGIAVSTARTANAVPVAEFTVAMITLAAKDAIWSSRRYVSEQTFLDREAEYSHTGLFGRTVGIVGASTIGALVIERLRGADLRVLAYDPYLSSARAEALGVEQVDDLTELARRSSILSIHAPAIPETTGMISRAVLAALPNGATIVNTARGSLVDQDALVSELEAGRLRAILDVTEPEVLPAGHPLYRLSNVFLTPHMAGSTGSELRRLGRAAVDEVARFAAGEPFEHPLPI